MGGACFKAADDDADVAVRHSKHSSGRHNASASAHGAGPAGGGGADGGGVRSTGGTGQHQSGEFRSFTLEELLQATDRFGEQNIVSEGGRQAVNVVYRGKLREPVGGAGQASSHSVAVKRFQKREWENATLFVGEAQKVAKVHYDGVTRLYGYCSEGDDRLLVAEYMPNSTLSQHLFHWEHTPMPWPTRLNVAVKVALALKHLGDVEDLEVYHDLNPYRVLFDKDLQPKLSCFGLMKPMQDGRFSSSLPNSPPEVVLSGVVTPKSVVYMYGALLLALFSGKTIRPSQFLELVETKSDLTVLIDSHLRNPPELDQAMELVPLIAESLSRSPDQRPTIGRIADFMCLLKSGRDPPGAAPAQGSGNGVGPAGQSGTFYEAAMNGDFDKMHAIMLANMSEPEPSFDVWNSDIQHALGFLNGAETAFRERRWEDAIKFYLKYAECGAPATPVLHAKQALAHLQLSQWQSALTCAGQVQSVQPQWLEALCLEGAALQRLGHAQEANGVFNSALKLAKQ